MRHPFRRRPGPTVDPKIAEEARRAVAESLSRGEVVAQVIERDKQIIRENHFGPRIHEALDIAKRRHA